MNLFTTTIPGNHLTSPQLFAPQRISDRQGSSSTILDFLFVNRINVSFIINDGRYLSSSLKKSYSCLEAIRSLPQNWNGNDAPAFTNDHIDYLRRIVRTLDIQPEINPTANGSIQLEYEKPEGDYLEYEVFADHQIKRFYYSAEGNVEREFIKEESMPSDVQSFNSAKL